MKSSNLFWQKGVYIWHNGCLWYIDDIDTFWIGYMTLSQRSRSDKFTSCLMGRISIERGHGEMIVYGV